jgi:hypothetical protein
MSSFPHQAAEIEKELRFGWPASLPDDMKKKLMMVS